MPKDESFLASVSDADLLRQMSAEPRGSAEARDAWAEFYRRHRRYLFAVCYRAYGTTLGVDRVTELVQDTFVRAYEKAETYKVDTQAVGDDLDRYRARAWLGRISENIFRDYFRHQPHVDFLDAADIPEGEQPPVPPDHEEPSHRANCLEQALGELTMREQDVLRATALWYQPGQRQQRMPNSAMKQLASSLDTTPANIRQIRVRAMNKLRALMAAD